MELSHALRKHALPTKIYTIFPTHGRHDTAPCPFWRSMLVGLVHHCTKLTWWHATRYIVNRPLHPWHILFRAESRVLTHPFSAYLEITQNLYNIQLNYCICQRTDWNKNDRHWGQRNAKYNPHGPLSFVPTSHWLSRDGYHICLQ